MNSTFTKLPSKENIKKTYESYHELFEAILEKVVNRLKDSVRLLSQPIYKTRVKNFESYYKKILRQKPEESADKSTLVCLTDMMGIRLICAFLEDINTALEQIKSTFEVKEVEVKGAEKKFSEFGYESVHVLVKIPKDCVPTSKKFENLLLPEEIVCEIQIRTILQDAWAEVEHELIYKTEFSPFDMPLRRKLASLNASLTLADITFQEIRDYQKKFHKAVEDRRNSFYAKADGLLNDSQGAQKEADIPRVSKYVQGTIDDLLLHAIQAHNAGDLNEAITTYTRIIDAVPESDRNVIAVIRKHRGMAYFALNDYENALLDFSESLKYDDKAFRTYYYIGIVNSIQKNYLVAIENFTESLNINPFQAHTHFRRAMAYYEIQEYENAMNDLNDAMSLGMSFDECKFLNEKIVKQLGLGM